MPNRVSCAGLVVGASLIVLAACDGSAWTRGEAGEAGQASGRVACVDPETGELVRPGPDVASPDVECRVPAEDKVRQEPVVRDLEDGGKAIDLNGRFDKKQVQPTSPKRLAVIDPETGELVTQRPSDAKAAARYDRSISRAQALAAKRSGRSQEDRELAPEVMANGGIKIDLKGRFQRPLLATLSKDGQLHLRHQH